MKVYLFFAHMEDVIEGILNFKAFPHNVYDYVNGDIYTLYAFTIKKKYRDNFLQLRKKEYFHLIEEEMTDEEYKSFSSENYLFELDKYLYENIKKKIELVTTLYEYDESKRLWIEQFSENIEEVFGFIPYIVTDTLKKKYQSALYKLGLNAMLLVADDELSRSMDKSTPNVYLDDDYVLDISNTHDKNLLGKKVTIPASIAGKTLNSFIHIFKDILVSQ